MTQVGSLREFAVAETQSAVIVGVLNVQMRVLTMLDSCRQGRWDMIPLQLNHIDRVLHDLRNAVMALEQRRP